MHRRRTRWDVDGENGVRGGRVRGLLTSVPVKVATAAAAALSGPRTAVDDDDSVAGLGLAFDAAWDISSCLEHLCI